MLNGLSHTGSPPFCYSSNKQIRCGRRAFALDVPSAQIPLVVLTFFFRSLRNGNSSELGFLTTLKEKPCKVPVYSTVALPSYLLQFLPGHFSLPHLRYLFCNPGPLPTSFKNSQKSLLKKSFSATVSNLSPDIQQSQCPPFPTPKPRFPKLLPPPASPASSEK